MPTLDPVRNFGKSQLNTGISAGATSADVPTGDAAKFPVPSSEGAFNVVIYNLTDFINPSDDPNKEIVRVTANPSGDTFTITRGQEGTAAVAHNTGGKTYGFILADTKKQRDDIEAAFANITDQIGLISGGAGGGTKIAIDTTQANATAAGQTNLYTINIPGGTLGTNDAIRFEIISGVIQTADSSHSISLGFKYGGTDYGAIAFTTDGASRKLSAVGYIVANGSTAAQKAALGGNQSGAGSSSAQANNGVAGTSTVDSSVDQDLVIYGVGTNAVSVSITVEGVIVEKISAAGGIGLINPSNQSFLFDDFIGGQFFTGSPTYATVGELGWYGLNVTDMAGDGVNHPGVCTISNSSTTNRSGIRLGFQGRAYTDNLKIPNVTMESLLKFNLPINGEAFFGFANADAVATAFESASFVKVGFVIRQSTGTVEGYTSNGSTQNVTTSGTTIAAATYYKLKMVTDATGDNVEFFVNGVSIGSLAVTNVGGTIAVVPWYQVGGALGQAMGVDYFVLNQQLTR